MIRTKSCCIIPAVGFMTVLPSFADADCFLFPVGEGPEEVCATGVFPDDPIVVEIGDAASLPSVEYVNNTERDMTFELEVVGNVISPGSRLIHSITLPPGTERSFSDVELFQTDNSMPIGTDHIRIGWSAFGSLSGSDDYVVTVERQFEVRLLPPRELQDVIQLPVRWCVMEGTPQAQGKHAGEMLTGTELFMFLQRANDEIWTPQAGILFRNAIADGIPVICDPNPPPSGFGDLGDVENQGGGQHFGLPVAACRNAWERIAPDQPGRVHVDVGAMHSAGPALGVAQGAGSFGHTDKLCFHPRSISPLEAQSMEGAVFVDPGLYEVPWSTYYDPNRDFTEVLAHEIGHQLLLSHGNGLDDNEDGSKPPVEGPRLFDGYCDPLCEFPANCDEVPLEDELTPVTTCEETSSLMFYTVSNCLELRPLQAECAREVARVSPGAVFNGMVNPGDGRLGGFPRDPCTTADDSSALMLGAGMSGTPSGDVTQFYHYISSTLPLDSQTEYMAFADLDNDPNTGCPVADLGVLTSFDGAEVVTEVLLDNAAAGQSVSGTVWQCVGGSFEEVSDPRIEANVEVQTVFGVSDPFRQFVVIGVPNAVLGSAGDLVRMQTMARPVGQPDHVERFPMSDTGALVSLVAPRLPECALSRVTRNPGGTTTVSVTGLLPNSAVEAYVGDELVGRGTTDGTGSADVQVAIPATSRPGVRPILVLIPATAVNAVCAVLVEGPAVTPATTASLEPEPNGSGWNNAVVTVSLHAVDVPNGPGIEEIGYSASGAQSIAPVTEPGDAAEIVIDVEGRTEISYFATNRDGLGESPRTTTVSLDATPPTIQYTGNRQTYGVLDAVDIVCAATDELSGVASSTCEGVSGVAYLFDPGENIVSAMAVDFAGNVGEGSVRFVIEVTYGDLCALTRQFIAATDLSPIEANLLGESLCAQLASAEAAATRGADRAKRNAIQAYVNQVDALTPEVFSESDAEILGDLAGAL